MASPLRGEAMEWQAHLFQRLLKYLRSGSGSTSPTSCRQLLADLVGQVPRRAVHAGLAGKRVQQGLLHAQVAIVVVHLFGMGGNRGQGIRDVARAQVLPPAGFTSHQNLGFECQVIC